MPPKAKFTREQITEAAFAIVRQEGMEGLTARVLGKALNSSACPVFTVFKNMEEVQEAAKDAAKALYAGYIRKGLEETPAFKGVGTQYIRFAIEEPKLFRMLFMSEQPEQPAIAAVLPVIDENYRQILASVQNGYAVSEGDAEKLYRHLWIYSHGIAVLCATKLCAFTADEISGMMTEIFIGLLKEIKGGKA